MSKDQRVQKPIMKHQFSPQRVAELRSLFQLYADPRQRKTDLKEILRNAKAFGLNSKYQLVFNLLQDLDERTDGNPLSFQQFLQQVANRVGNPFSQEGRKANFSLLDVTGKEELDLDDLRHLNEQLGYGYGQEQLLEIVHQVGGFGAKSITWDKFNKFIENKNKRKP